MIVDRKKAFDNISRRLAIERVDIQHHQSINELSINIHSENFFRDIFNFIYERKYVNENHKSQNAGYIDLVDREAKQLVQITSTRKKDKIVHTLKCFRSESYKGYDIQIYYLLEKPNPTKKTIKELEEEFPQINLSTCLKDHKDLVGDINDLEETRLLELNRIYFSDYEEKYTNHVVLQLVCENLVEKCRQYRPSYDDDLVSIAVEEKIELNNINDRVSSQIQVSLDYTPWIRGEMAMRLRQYVMEELYKEILIRDLRKVHSPVALRNLSVIEVQKIAIKEKANFSRLIFNLRESMRKDLIVDTYDGMTFSWIIISYFFEICDIGKKS